MWSVNKTQSFIDSLKRHKVSSVTEDSIFAWAKTASFMQTSRMALISRGTNNAYEIWSVRIPDSDHKQGRSGGFRLICFYYTDSKNLYLDLMERRKDLGGKSEKPKAQQDYNRYVESLKTYLEENLN